MTKRKRRFKRRLSTHPGRTRHSYPKGRKPDDWVVPFKDGEHACIHHGHTNPDDHGLCGPTIFCCAKAASLYVDIFPKGAEARSEWQLTDAAHLATWMDAGVNVFYFVFCDPERSDGLLVMCLIGQYAREVLLKCQACSTGTVCGRGRTSTLSQVVRQGKSQEIFSP